jgi:hypothetical protein
MRVHGLSRASKTTCNLWRHLFDFHFRQFGRIHCRTCHITNSSLSAERFLTNLRTAFKMNQNRWVTHCYVEHIQCRKYSDTLFNLKSSNLDIFYIPMCHPYVFTTTPSLSGAFFMFLCTVFKSSQIVAGTLAGGIHRVWQISNTF